MAAIAGITPTMDQMAFDYKPKFMFPTGILALAHAGQAEEKARSHAP
jgi:hypothetical protein